jgi:hypothetical protein
MARHSHLLKTLPVISLTACVLLACTPSADWVKAQKDQVKAILVDLPAKPNASVTPGQAHRFGLLLSVAKQTMLSESGGIPLYNSGGGNLGARLYIQRPYATYERASTHVDQCIGTAAQEGVVVSLSTGPSNADGFYTQFSSQSIEGFVNRFKACLKGVGYTVE